MLTLRFCICASCAFKRFIAIVTGLHPSAIAQLRSPVASTCTLSGLTFLDAKGRPLQRSPRPHSSFTGIAHLGRRFARCSRTIYCYFLLPAVRLHWRFKRRLHRIRMRIVFMRDCRFILRAPDDLFTYIVSQILSVPAAHRCAADA